MRTAPYSCSEEGRESTSHGEVVLLSLSMGTRPQIDAEPALHGQEIPELIHCHVDKMLLPTLERMYFAACVGRIKLGKLIEELLCVGEEVVLLGWPQIADSSISAPISAPPLHFAQELQGAGYFWFPHLYNGAGLPTGILTCEGSPLIPVVDSPGRRNRLAGRHCHKSLLLAAIPEGAAEGGQRSSSEDAKSVSAPVSVKWRVALLRGSGEPTVGRPLSEAAFLIHFRTSSPSRSKGLRQ